jgi:hypothetical protein
MPLSDPELWDLIRTWPLPYREERDDSDPPKRLCTRFEHNLRKIGDWTDAASEEITAAYRRFLYLKAVSGETLTPPVWIDEAWHLHMEFPQNYAALEAAVGRPILHRQDLSAVERTEAFDRGRKLWIEEFGEFPDNHIWPTSMSLRRDNLGVALMFGGFGIAFVGVMSGIAMAASFGGLGVQVLGYLGLSSMGLGGLMFLVGWYLAGNVSPETISRCG